MRHHVTGSSIDRFLQCQHWAHPSVALPKQVANENMKEGTRRHKIAEFVLKGGHHFPEPKDYELCNAAVALRDIASVLQVEQGYAYDPVKRTSRLIAGRTDEGYEGARDHEIPATLDAVYRDADGVLVLRDWKLGASGANYYSEPGSAGQLLLGMQALRTSGAFSADVLAIEFADDQKVYRALITHAALDKFADDLAFAWTSVTHVSQPVAPVTGPGCKWCPLLNSCSAHHAMVTSSAKPITLNRRLPIAIATKQDADDFVNLVEYVEDYIERMKEQLKTFARSNVVTKGKQQYREEMEERMTSKDLGPINSRRGGWNYGSDVLDAEELDPEAGTLHLVWKFKGEPKPVFRWRKL